MKQEILDNLFGDRDVLTDMIIALSPTTPTESQALQTLMVRRDRLTAVIQETIDADIDQTTPGIVGATQKVADASKELGTLASAFASIASAISLVDQIVQTITALLAAVL
jgi:hypothetical protein